MLLHVKFYAYNNDPVRSYAWDFGDGSPIVTTINKEVEHLYDLLTKDTWLVNSGTMPIQGLETYSGNWTNVKLTITDLSGNVYTRTNVAFIYELTGGVQQDIWQKTDATGEEIQKTISTGTVYQNTDF